jgi:hypothetical protein
VQTISTADDPQAATRYPWANHLGASAPYSSKHMQRRLSLRLRKERHLQATEPFLLIHIKPGITVTEKIVAFGLLTQSDLQVLGPSFSRVWPVDEKPCFTQLLQAIDEADAALGKEAGGRTSSPYPSGSARHNPIGDGRR